MIKEIINIAYSNFCLILSRLDKFKYRSKSYNTLVFFRNTETDIHKLKLLPIYNNLEFYKKRSGFYTFVYSVILAVSLVSLI